MLGSFCRQLLHGGCTIALLLGLSEAAVGQAVTVDDLAGMVIEADIDRAQTVRRGGRTIPVTIHQRWRLSVDVDGTVAFTMRPSADTPRGRRTAKASSGVFTLDESREVPSRGGGEAVWKFTDGTLTFLRTFPSGAYRASFAFAREADRLTCTVDSAYARENGRGAIRLESPFGGGEVTILRSNQVSSRCTVSKAGKASGERSR
jgi:hypothetical protein